MLVEAPRNLFVRRIKAQGKISGKHSWRVTLGRIVRIGNSAGTSAVLGSPLMRTSRALGQLPFVPEQVLEIIVAPFGRRPGPSDLKTAADGVASVTRAEGALPAEALLFDVASLRFRTDILSGNRRTVGFAEGVSAGYQRYCFLVIHRHAGKRLTDIARGGDGIRLAARPFRIHVDQTHLYGSERIRQITIAAVAFVGQPLAFGS